MVGQIKVLPEKKISFLEKDFFPPLEKVVNLVKLLAVSVRCNLGRNPPEEGNGRTNACVYVQLVL